MYKILIVDDHPPLAEGLKKIIEESVISSTIDLSHSVENTLKLLKSNIYDLLLLDIELPDGNGIDLCKQIRSKYPSIKILSVSAYSDFSYVQNMMENGASGYLLKNSSPTEYIEGIISVINNKPYLSKEIERQKNNCNKIPVYLTPREKEILKFISEGYTNPEIAVELSLSVETINRYRKNLLIKLGAKNTAILVRMVIEQKLV